MVDPTQALLLSTIATDPSDWHIGRFSLLGEMIRTAGLELDSSFVLTIGDYPKDDAQREALQGDLRSGRFGQIWLIAPDMDNGPDPGFFLALESAVMAGSDLVIARDHTDLGSCLLQLQGCLNDVGQTQTFQRSWPNLPQDREYADEACAAIITPCVVTGQNGGVQICRQRADQLIGELVAARSARSTRPPPPRVAAASLARAHRVREPTVLASQKRARSRANTARIAARAALPHRHPTPAHRSAHAAHRAAAQPWARSKKKARRSARSRRSRRPGPVSYTHLTLPTKA